MPRISVSVDKESWDKRFITLPPGDYTLVCDKATHGQSKQKGSPQLELQWKIEAPASVKDETGADVDISKQRVFDTISLVPKAAGFLRAALAGCGVPFQMAGELCDFDSDHFQGKRVVAKIVVETNPADGIARNRVKSYRVA
jgi:hypothetical protein